LAQTFQLHRENLCLTVAGCLHPEKLLRFMETVRDRDLCVVAVLHKVPN
jgi:hypothetical protein